jgi:hypothetical protein
MTESMYSPPVTQLLTYADCLKLRKWPQYVEELSLGTEHIPDLIRMATDMNLNWADSESLEVWAPTHAWRALGQLKAEAAITPLLSVADELEDNDWFNEEMPIIFAMMGTAAIPDLKTFLATPTHKLFSRVMAAESLEAIGKAYPDARADCVAVITEQLVEVTGGGVSTNTGASICCQTCTD